MIIAQNEQEKKLADTVRQTSDKINSIVNETIMNLDPLLQNNIGGLLKSIAGSLIGSIALQLKAGGVNAEDVDSFIEDIFKTVRQALLLDLFKVGSGLAAHDVKKRIN